MEIPLPKTWQDKTASIPWLPSDPSLLPQQRLKTNAKLKTVLTAKTQKDKTDLSYYYFCYYYYYYYYYDYYYYYYYYCWCYNLYYDFYFSQVSKC